MSSPNNPAHADFVKALGGPTAVAEYLTKQLGRPVSQQTISMSYLHRAGLPWKYRALIAAMAKQHGVDLPAGFLVPRA